VTGARGPHHDGDGWVECVGGHRHWGRFGAAGLLVHRSGGDGAMEVLLQHRVEWSHHGGTWGLLGGARHRDEPPVAAALREAAEEAGVIAEAVQVSGVYVDDHGGWAYSTAVAAEIADTGAHATSAETVEVTWWPVARLSELPLHPGFAQSWPALREATTPLTVVVDAANVVGSRPDGWWKDRAGAARRLIAGVLTVCDAGIPDEALPESLARPVLQRWWPQSVVVVEGAARSVAPADPGEAPVARVSVRAAPGSGDDTIVDAIAEAGDGPRLVVTADRELRNRCAALGATVVGPSWLWALLDSAGEPL
jgi:8-oxo-dGTP pyrophosphatase MutT (NUDIX family)